MRQARVAIATALVLATSALASVQGNSTEGRMRILGRAIVEAVPDHARVLVGVSSKAPSPTAALDQNSAIAKRIIESQRSLASMSGTSDPIR